jgi:hypothetical protein
MGMDTNGVRPRFEKEITDLRTHSWTLERLRTTSTIAELAFLLAELIMKYRCRYRDDIFEMWSERRTLKSEVDDAQLQLLTMMVAAAVGALDAHRPAHHVEGFVAEHLWYFLAHGRSTKC